MSQIVVGVADCKWSTAPEDVLVTYALGSCIAVALYDPVSLVGGMLHFMLPDSGIDRQKALASPCMFADTGMRLLLDRIREAGGERSRLSVRIAGGARVLETNGLFHIGKRNYQALRKILWKTGLMIHAEEVGGTQTRTVALELASGRCTWRSTNGLRGELSLHQTTGGAK